MKLKCVHAMVGYLFNIRNELLLFQFRKNRVSVKKNCLWSYKCCCIINVIWVGCCIFKMLRVLKNMAVSLGKCAFVCSNY